MAFDPNPFLARLKRYPGVLNALLQGTSDLDARWKPENEGWSIVEVVTHLADEEEEDFRQRLLLTLDDPSQEWPKIDPDGWALRRSYNNNDLHEQMARFSRQRAASLRELSRRRAIDWSGAYQHPRYGPITAAQLMAAWSAHDLLHLRQLTKLLYTLNQRHASDHRTPYAGLWPAESGERIEDYSG